VVYTADTQVYRVDANAPDPDIIAVAARTLQQGGLVAFPTETVYGLGADALDSDAINRIYDAKKRPATDPVIAHIHDITQLEYLARDVPPTAYKLASRFWPGPLTLILKRAEAVPVNIATGRDTIAIRMPSHPVAVALLKAANLPIAAPSANTFTRPSATSAHHVLQDLDGRVDIVLDGGSTTIGLESTVLDLTQDVPVVLRPGGITVDALREVLPHVQLKPRYNADDSESESSPGQMLKHYSPSAQVMVYTGEHRAVMDAIHRECARRLSTGERVGVLLLRDDIDSLPGDVQLYDLGDDVETVSKRLFDGLRVLDLQGVDVILTRDFGREGLGAALWDRLVRAAEGNVIKVE